MPYKFETLKKKIPRELNRNVKISLEDRETIRQEYKIIKSQRKLATKWGVSRRLIQFILDPKKEEKSKLNYSINQKGGKYYDRKKHNLAVQKYRKYKQKLYLQNKLMP